MSGLFNIVVLVARFGRKSRFLQMATPEMYCGIKREQKCSENICSRQIRKKNIAASQWQYKWFSL